MLDACKKLTYMLRDVGFAHLKQLLISTDHSAYLTRHRAETIAARIRMVALAFSVLTLAWIWVDSMVLPWPAWAILGTHRLIASVCFVYLSMAAQRNISMKRVLLLLGGLLALPLSLFLAALVVLSGLDLTAAAAIDFRLYSALPVVIVAGLGVMPLTVLEGMVFAVPVILVATLGPMLTQGFDLVSQLSTMWVLGLILSVYLLESMIQLNYVISLLRRASSDPLTGTFTRISGNEIIEVQFRMACQQNAPFAVAFIDLDNFKSVNDTYGHDAGDTVLKNAVNRLHQLLRRSDVIIRWGGEEFVVLLAGSTLQGLHIAMQRIVDEWLGQRPDGAPVTASIGVAEWMADGIQDWAELIELADARMYQAKKSGKARCVMGGQDVILPAVR